MPPCSARCTTSCSPAPPWTTSAPTCAPAHRWPRPAVSSRQCGCGRCAPGSPICTGRSSPISPASTGPGGCWPRTPPICRCATSPSPPGTSLSAIPLRPATDSGPRFRRLLGRTLVPGSFDLAQQGRVDDPAPERGDERHVLRSEPAAWLDVDGHLTLVAITATIYAG